MSNLFDDDQGQQLALKALKMLEKPPEIQKQEDPFTLNGSLVMNFIIVRNPQEYQSGGGIAFQPDYVHQFFRESNEIYGYKDLQIKVYVTALHLIPYVKITYSEMTEDADELSVGLGKLYEGGYLINEQKFLETLAAEQESTPVGEQVDQYNGFTIHRSNITTNGFYEYKLNLQAFLLILIDGAQVPCESDCWVYYTLYEGSTFVGLTTVYKFCIGDCERHRLSQMLFIPSHQRKGHGSHMLQAVYKDCHLNPRCVQVTLEDPSDDFQVMRDITDCKVLRPQFDDIVAMKLITSPEQLVELSQERLLGLMKSSKLHSQQIRKVYQIYLYALLNKKSSALMVQYSQIVLRNLQKQMQPFTRQKNILVKFEDGSSLNSKQLHLLDLKEKEDLRSVNYEKVLYDEICFYEVIANKLRRDNII